MSKFKLSLSAVAVSVLLCACDSSTFTAESTEIDIVPILDSDGTILNLLTPRQVTVASCDRSAYPIRSATSPYDYDDNFAPAKTIDGSLSQTSRWSSKGIGRSITFDLGTPNLVNRIQTAWYKANIRTAFFDVDTSVDGVTWTNVLAGASAQGSEGLIAFDLQATNARYVQIIGQGNSVSNWNSLIEAEILGCSGSAPGNPTGGNLVSNGTFEDGLNGWDEVEPASESGQTYAGSGSAKITDDGSINHNLTIKPDTQYQVSAWIEGNGRIGVVRAGNTIDALGTGNDYDLVTFTFNSGSANNAQLFANAVSGTVRIDRVQMVEIGDATAPPQPEPQPQPQPQHQPQPQPPNEPNKNVNVVFNGTFENGLSGWAQVEPAQGSSEAYDGDRSGKIFSSGVLSQNVFLEPRSRYRLSVWVQGDPTVGINLGNQTIETTGDGSGEYTQVSLEFDTGNANEGQLFAKASSSSDSSRIDNFEVVKISDNPTVGLPPVDPDSVFDFSIWEVEGESPITRDGLMAFDALEQCVITPNGNGCRHEQKVQESERYGLTEQYERFSASIEASLSRGSETIVVQHHPESTGTLSALYISDNYLLNDYPDVENGVASDGIFDVYVTVRRPDGTRNNDVVILGTVRSGQAFNYEVINDHGRLTMTGLGSTATVTSADSSSSYLKFGNYQQARDAFTRDRLELNKPHPPEARGTFLDYYAENGFTESRIVFRNVFYQRILD